MSAQAFTHRAAGFTLIELVLVLVLVGILAAVFVPRLGLGEMRARGFFDDTLAATRYAHKLAMASGCHVQVEFSAGGYGLTQRADCSSGAFDLPVALPGSAGSQPYAGSAPPGVSVAGTTFFYDGLGRPSTAQTVQVGGHAFAVAADTGFVHIP